MNWTRNLTICVTAACAACALADTGSSLDPSAAVVKPKAAAQGSILSFPVPKVGFRVGGGNWHEFMADVGMDVTFNVPFLPLPAMRVDGEVWGKPSNFGKDRRGNALSVMAVQTFIAGYMGFGPSYYFTDDFGDHHSGIGFKILGGLALPHSVYAEAGMILGPSSPPVFFTIGQRF